MIGYAVQRDKIMASKKTPHKRKPLAEIRKFLAPYDVRVQKIALAARALVLEVVPDALEQTDAPAKMLAYGFKPTYKDLICVIMPQKGWVNLGFPRGAELDDPAKLLTGTGKRARHVKLDDLAQLKNPALRDLIEQSVAPLKEK